MDYSNKKIYDINLSRERSLFANVSPLNRYSNLYETRLYSPVSFRLKYLRNSHYSLPSYSRNYYKTEIKTHSDTIAEKPIMDNNVTAKQDDDKNLTITNRAVTPGGSRRVFLTEINTVTQTENKDGKKTTDSDTKTKLKDINTLFREVSLLDYPYTSRYRNTYRPSYSPVYRPNQYPYGYDNNYDNLSYYWYQGRLNQPMQYDRRYYNDDYWSDWRNYSYYYGDDHDPYWQQRREYYRPSYYDYNHRNFESNYGGNSMPFYSRNAYNTDISTYNNSIYERPNRYEVKSQPNPYDRHLNKYEESPFEDLLNDYTWRYYRNYFFDNQPQHTNYRRMYRYY